jgi:hypothetical protein
VEREEGVGVVPLERFDPQALKEVQPEDVELRNGATYIIVPRRGNSYEKRVSSFAVFCSVVDFQIIADLCSKISPLPSFVSFAFCSSKA